MGKDIAAAYDAAAKNAHVTGVVPVGLAWNRAMDTGVAGDHPYAGIPAGKINLWAWDNYHASAYGYYLEALMVFGKVTGKDPLSLGDNETVADDMGFSKPQTHALQQIAHDELAASQLADVTASPARSSTLCIQRATLRLAARYRRSGIRGAGWPRRRAPPRYAPARPAFRRCRRRDRRCR